jgi:hypothetical protein
VLDLTCQTRWGADSLGRGFTSRFAGWSWRIREVFALDLGDLVLDEQEEVLDGIEDGAEIGLRDRQPPELRNASLRGRTGHGAPQRARAVQRVRLQADLRARVAWRRRRGASLRGQAGVGQVDGERGRWRGAPSHQRERLDSGDLLYLIFVRLAVQPMSRPFTVSLTSMLPRVALEYGHT